MVKGIPVLASVMALAASTAWAQDPRVELGLMAAWTQSDGVTGDAVLAGDGVLYNSIEPKDAFFRTAWTSGSSSRRPWRSGASSASRRARW
jgi:hypothetical protein